MSDAIYNIDRESSGIPCKCGGYADLVDCTEKECMEFGCGRDSPGFECCARAFLCRICKSRIVGTADAPDVE